MNRTFLRALSVLLLTVKVVADDPRYLEIQQTFSPVDHRWPMINNQGEFVYCQQVDGLWQVFSNTRGQLTSANSVYTSATSPAIADDGSFICFRHLAGQNRDCIVTYPGPSIIDCSSQNGTSYRFAGEYPSMASNGTIIWSYRYCWGWDQQCVSRLFVSGSGQVSSGDNWDGSYPDVNAAGQFVYQVGSEIHVEGRGVVARGVIVRRQDMSAAAS